MMRLILFWLPFRRRLARLCQVSEQIRKTVYDSSIGRSV